MILAGILSTLPIVLIFGAMAAGSVVKRPEVKAKIVLRDASRELLVDYLMACGYTRGAAEAKLLREEGEAQSQ